MQPPVSRWKVYVRAGNRIDAKFFALFLLAGHAFPPFTVKLEPFAPIHRQSNPGPRIGESSPDTVSDSRIGLAFVEFAR